MSRPRQNTDQEILAAAFRAIARLGPARLTLGDVAGEAGVTAASLVQRFGSKRDLLLAAAADVAGGHVYIFHGLRQTHRSPLAALLGLADAMCVMGSTPDEVAHSLAFLQMNVNDAAFLAPARASALGMREGIRALIRDAIAAGELRKCDSLRLARALHAALNGSILDWVIHREGSMTSWVRRDLKMVLDPYRTR